MVDDAARLCGQRERDDDGGGRGECRVEFFALGDDTAGAQRRVASAEHRDVASEGVEQIDE